MLPLLLAGVGGAAVGQGLNYLGARNEAGRRAGAIDQYSSTQALLDALSRQAVQQQIAAQQEGQITAARGLGQPAMQQAAGQEATRQANVAALLAALAPGTGAAPGPATPATQAAATTRAAGRYAVRRSAGDAQRLLRTQDQARGELSTEALLPALANEASMQEVLRQTTMAGDTAREKLNRTLSTTGNASNNLQLLGALSRMGGNAAFSFAGR